MKIETGSKRILCWVLAALLTPLASGCAAVESATRGQTHIVINEVVSSNKRSLPDEALGSPDWIELHNAGSAPVDLAGWGLSDSLQDFHKFVFPQGTVLQGGEYLVVYACDANADAESTVLRTGFGLSKSGDFLFLTDAYYGLIQQMELPGLISDVSYARTAGGGYGYCASPTPGAPNADRDIKSSLDGLFTDQNLSALSIAEVCPAGDDTGPWAELFNSSGEAVRLENYYLSDDGANPMKWQLPEGTLEAGGRVLIYLTGTESGQPPFAAPFKLGKDDTQLTLTDLTGRALSHIAWETGIPKGLSVVAGEGICYTAEPTPAEANSESVFGSFVPTVMDQSDPVILSELLRDNRLSSVDSDGDRPEWVELWNRSQGEVSLKDYYLSDNPDNLFKWALPAVTVPPGGYVLVYLSGKDRTQGELHASFGLGDDEDCVILTNLSGIRTDVLEAPLGLGANVSIGRTAEGETRYYAQPTPGFANGYGFLTAEEIGYFESGGVYIAEVSAVSAAKSDGLDWIELYNGGQEAVQLSGWHLSDDPDEPMKFSIGSLSLEPGAYGLVYCSSHASRQGEGVASFGISPSGETLVLSRPDGTIADRFETGALSTGLSSGRLEGETSVKRVFFTRPTPGKANQREGAYTGYASQPVFSQTALYHTEAFEVTIQCASQDAAIYYTTDGSTPTARSTQYQGPVQVNRNMVLRAIAAAPGALNSALTTATYLFTQPHTVPVVSMVGNQTDIDQVYAVTERNKKIEREVTFQYFETGGALGIEFDAGVKVKGAGTLIYTQKSFSIKLRAAYGQSRVEYPFFADRDYPYTGFSSLMLRNSGQDLDDAHIRDPYFSRAVMGLYIDSAMTRPVALYINGKYWGLYDFGEDLDQDYLATHYGVDPDQVDIVRRNETTLHGSNEDFLRVRAYGLMHDLNGESAFQEFSKWVDVAYFTDYMIAQTYFINSDMFNQKYWRAQDYSIKWRPIYYDLDMAMGGYTRNMIGHYFSENGIPSANGSLTYMDIYVGLYQNRAWRKMAAERYVEVVVTQFDTQRLLELLDQMTAEIEPEMERQIARWRLPSSMRVWRSRVAELRSYIERRQSYGLQAVRQFFGLSQAKLQEYIDRYSGT